MSQLAVKLAMHKAELVRKLQNQCLEDEKTLSSRATGCSVGCRVAALLRATLAAA